MTNEKEVRALSQEFKKKSPWSSKVTLIALVLVAVIVAMVFLVSPAQETGQQTGSQASPQPQVSEQATPTQGEEQTTPTQASQEIETASVLPHLVQPKGVNDVGTIVLSPPQRVISYIDKDPQTGVNQLFLYVLETGEKIRLTSENASVTNVRILDNPVNAVLYLTEAPRAFNFIKLEDLSITSLPINYAQEEIFGISADATRFASFVIETKDNDGDGIPNDQDPDIDGDGISNIPDSDSAKGALSNDPDTDDDNDGIPDEQDSNPHDLLTDPRVEFVLRNLPDFTTIQKYQSPLVDEPTGRMGPSEIIAFSSDGRKIYFVAHIGSGNRGVKLIEYDLESRATRDIISYNEEGLVVEGVNGSVGVMSISHVIPKDNKLYFTTRLNKDIYERVLTGGIGSFVRSELVFTLNEFDIQSDQVTDSFPDIFGQDMLFSSDGKVYFRLAKAEIRELGPGGEVTIVQPGRVDFVVHDLNTRTQRILFNEAQFNQQHGNLEKLVMSLVGFGTTENELIFKANFWGGVGGQNNDRFYSYNADSGEFTELFSATVLERKTF